MTRRSVWSDARIIERLRSFVPVADEVGHLQRAKDAEGRFFRIIAEQGHYRGRTKPTRTRQGIYAFGPEGTFLGAVNTRSAERMLKMLDGALARWKQRAALRKEQPATPRVAPEDARRWEQLRPTDGLILKVYTRDLPREKVTRGWRGKAWNQDVAWFRKSEARRFLPAKPEPGATCTLPGPLADRLMRLYFRDFARGQTPPCPPGSLEKGRLTSRVTRVEGHLVHLALEGEAHVETRGRWAIGGSRDTAPEVRTRGFQGRLLGDATWDLRAQRFTAFRLVALGERWGATKYNGRGDDAERAPIGFAFVLADDEPQNRVAPSRIWSYGWRHPGR